VVLDAIFPDLTPQELRSTLLFRETKRNRQLGGIQLPPKIGPRHHFLHALSQWKRSTPLPVATRSQWCAQRCAVYICDARKAAASAISAAMSRQVRL
jgi:hypothetical protein